VGIAASEQEVVTGRQLAELGSTEAPQFLEMVQSARVLASVTSQQKLHIVEALVKLGHIVAVTGAGVNDALALRRAHIGVALGSGTNVAQDTASIIITDDNFASIEAGVEEGRLAYDNIRKVTYLLISTGAAEVILFILALLTDLPLPLFAVQLLWLNLVINGIGGVALACEAGEPRAMIQPPRRPTEGIFNKRMVQQTVISGATMGLVSYTTWYGLLQAGWDEAAARNLVLLLMMLFQTFHVFNCRSEYVSAFKVPLRRNVLLVGGVVVALGLHLLAMQSPLMQALLSVASVSLPEFLYLLFLASTVLGVMSSLNPLALSVAGESPAQASEATAAFRENIVL
jgi:magnesium-transporting ATPase (P-type)